MGEVDEVGDVTEAQAVQQVTGRATQLQAERQSQQAVLQRREHVVEDDGADREHGRDGEKDTLALQDAERSAGVCDVRDFYEPVIVGPRLAYAQVVPHD